LYGLFSLYSACLLSADLQPDKTTGTIKEQLAATSPFLEQLCRKKEKRVKEFADVQLQIQTIRGEIAGSLQVGDHLGTPHVDEDDLSMKKLNEFLFELQALQKEKVGIDSVVCFAQSKNRLSCCSYANLPKLKA
jgi:protein regulator of cytokinesis 1